MENAVGRNDIRGVRRNALQMSAFIDKMLLSKFLKIEMLQWGGRGVIIRLGIAFKCEC